MAFLPWIIAGVFLVAFFIVVAVLVSLTRGRGALVVALEKSQRDIEAVQRELSQERERAGALLKDYRQVYDSYQRLEAALAAAKKEASDAVASNAAEREELEKLRKEMQRRPQFRQQTYKIISIGLPKTGKTSLTLKWCNPLWELRNVQGTSFDKYTRTVSSVLSPQSNVLLNHVFEVYDYGGEQIVDAHDTMVLNDIHGLLFVVDLGGADARAVDQERIDAQIREFGPGHLRFFFKSPRITKTCRTVVLFINKSDLLSGTPREVEALAKEKFRELIDNLTEFSDHVEVEVLVGSAVSGHNAHMLMPHFIRKLLPSEAYDDQLMQDQTVSDGFGGGV